MVRIDRLARSLSHLLEVIERLEAKGAHFRSLHDPIDTTSPQGKFTLQMLGAAAEFERALIRERTIAVRRARQERYHDALARSAPDWVPLVRRHRPDMACEDLVRLVNARRTDSPPWSVERLTGP